MKATTILSKLEAMAARHEQLSLDAELSTDYWGELKLTSCTFRFDRHGANTWVVGQVFPPGRCSDTDMRGILSRLDERIVAFLEKEL